MLNLVKSTNNTTKTYLLNQLAIQNASDDSLRKSSNLQGWKRTLKKYHTSIIIFSYKKSSSEVL